MSKLIIANWKMNPSSLEDAVVLAKKSDVVHLVIAPPFPFIGGIGKAIKKASLGAQNISEYDEGAFTGEVSGGQLKSMGVRYVIVGHSERRRYFGDTTEIVAKKIVKALDHGLVPIVCIGESQVDKREGRGREVIERELKSALLHTHGRTGEMILAYEPVWAISTEASGEADTPERAAEHIRFMKEILHSVRTNLSVRFIYGGSVNAKNCEGFLAREEIEGALVGGASLKEEAIKHIVETAKK